MTQLSHNGAHSIIPVSTHSRTCPNCRSSYLERIQRRVIDRLIGLVVPLKRYHCGSCGWQGNLKFKRA